MKLPHRRNADVELRVELAEGRPGAGVDGWRRRAHARDEADLVANEPARPYQYAPAQELLSDWDRVDEEIRRFAGEDAHAAPTVIHWAMVQPPALKALAERGVLALPAGSTVMRFLPPLVISEQDVGTVVEQVAQVLQAS